MGAKKVNDRLKEQYGLKSQLLHAYRLEMPACTGELSNLSEKKNLWHHFQNCFRIF